MSEWTNTWMKDHPGFVAWWKQHDHSGFFEDSEGMWGWAITPWLAWQVDQYRTEFSQATGSPYYSDFLISKENPSGAAHKTKPKELQDDIL